MVLPQHCSLKHFFCQPASLPCNFHCIDKVRVRDWARVAVRLRIRVRIRAGVRLRVEKTTKTRASGTLKLQKACQGQHGAAPTLLPPHFTSCHQPCSHAPFTATPKARVMVKVSVRVSIRFRVRVRDGVQVMLRVSVEKNTKSRAPVTLQQQKACQGQHGTAPALLLLLFSPSHQLHSHVAFRALT